MSGNKTTNEKELHEPFLLETASGLIDKYYVGDEKSPAKSDIIKSLSSYCLNDDKKERPVNREKLLSVLVAMLKKKTPLKSYSRFFAGVFGEPTVAWDTSLVKKGDEVRVEIVDSIPILHLPETWSYNDPLVDYISGIVIRFGGYTKTFKSDSNQSVISLDKEYIDRSPSLGYSLKNWASLPEIKFQKYETKKGFSHLLNLTIKYYLAIVVSQKKNKLSFLKPEVRNFLGKEINLKDIGKVETSLESLCKFGKTNVFMTLVKPIIDLLREKYSKKNIATVLPRNWFVQATDIFTYNSFVVKQINSSKKNKKASTERIEIVPKDPFNQRGLCQDERTDMKTLLSKSSTPYGVFRISCEGFDKCSVNDITDDYVNGVRFRLKEAYGFYYESRRVIRQRNDLIIRSLKIPKDKIIDTIKEIEKTSLKDFISKHKLEDEYHILWYGPFIELFDKYGLPTWDDSTNQKKPITNKTSDSEELLVKEKQPSSNLVKESSEVLSKKE